MKLFPQNRIPWLILLIGMLLIILVGPKGNFPLNDDWRYAYMVRSLWVDGRPALNSQIAPTMILQAYWGYLFVLLAGYFSFSVLRVSTLVLAVVGLWFFYRLLRKEAPQQAEWKGMALLALNPVYFVLAFSFMTDVPFLTFCLISIWSYLRFLQTNNRAYRLLGALVALLAVWIRQPGLLLILAFELSWWWNHRRSHRQWLLSIFFILLAMGNYFLIEAWAKPALGLEGNYIQVESEYLYALIQKPGEFFFDVGARFVMTVFYMGLFLLPVGWVIASAFFKQLRRAMGWFLVLMVVNVLLAVTGSWWLERGFPFGGNIFYNWGLGPLLLYDTNTLQLPPPDQLPWPVMFVFGLFCQMNGSMLLVLLGSYLWKRWASPVNLFLLLLLFFYFGSMSIFSFFDRYLLLILILAIIWLYKMELIRKTARHGVFYVLIALFAAFSVAGTHDYLSWNRVVHEGRKEYLRKGIPQKELDAGLAKNGFFGLDPEEAVYHFSFRKLEGMEVVDEYGYFSWLWLEQKRVYLLK